MAVTTAVAAIGSALFTAYGAIQQGQAAASAAEYQAKIDERNRILADQDRQRDVQTANLAAEDKRRENTRQLASIRAQYGSSGLEMAGTPLDILSDVSTDMALDERRVQDEGNVRNREGALKMLGYSESAAMSRAAGKNAKSGSYITAAGALIGGASSAGRALSTQSTATT